VKNKFAVQFKTQFILTAIISATSSFASLPAAHATTGLRSEAKVTESLELLCEREDGDAYLAVFLNKTTGVYNVQTSGALELGRTEVVPGSDEMTILSETLRIPILIPRGRHEVAIDGSVFYCDY
jgi:hypothetical protein